MNIDPRAEQPGVIGLPAQRLDLLRIGRLHENGQLRLLGQRHREHGLIAEQHAQAALHADLVELLLGESRLTAGTAAVWKRRQARGDGKDDAGALEHDCLPIWMKCDHLAATIRNRDDSNAPGRGPRRESRFLEEPGFLPGPLSRRRQDETIGMHVARHLLLSRRPAMSTRALICTGACRLILTSAVIPQAGPPAALSGLVDVAGDPLPAGAVARLGVTRFRHGGWDAGMSIHPDGNTLVTTAESGADVRFWEIAT